MLGHDTRMGNTSTSNVHFIHVLIALVFPGLNKH